MADAGQRNRILDFGPGLQRRRALTRRHRLMLAGIAAGIVLLAALIGWLFFASSVFDVTQVQVNGVRLLTQQQVVDAAEVPFGTPIARLDPAQIATRVAAEAQVAQVTVHTSWPHTVMIDVTERTLVVQRAQSGQWQWVDARGVVFHSGATKDSHALVVSTPSASDVRLLSDCATVAASLPSAIASRVQLIAASSPDQITLTLNRSQTVRWGSADQSALKAQVAAALLKTGKSVIDVSSPGQPTTK